MNITMKEPARIKSDRPDQVKKRSEKPLFYPGQFQLSLQLAAGRPISDPCDKRLLDLYRAMDIGA